MVYSLASSGLAGARVGAPPFKVMPEIMYLRYFMQVHGSGPDDFQALPFVKLISGIHIVYVISNRMIFKLYYLDMGPFGQCQSGESLYYTKDLSFLAPRDKRCLPAQSSSMHA